MYSLSLIPALLRKKMQDRIATPEAETPAILFCPDTLRYNVQKLSRELAISSENLYFSVKSNNQPAVIETLNAENTGFEIGSDGELKLLTRYNIDPKRIIYSNPVKMPTHIAAAHQYGIDCFVFDCESELHKIATHAPGARVYARLSISNEGAKWELTRKFGAKQEEIISLFKSAQQLGLQPCGLTIHVGWNNDHLQTWNDTLDTVIQIAEECQQHNLSLNFVDLGGGFPAHLIDQYAMVEQIAATISAQLNTLRHQYHLNIIAEPGSFVVANTAVMLTQVFDIVEREGKRWVFADSGINQGFYWIHTGLEYAVESAHHQHEAAKRCEAIVTGPTCDTHDIFAEQSMLPASLKVGDFLAVFPAGAYINSAESYNGFSCPPLVTV